MMVQILDHMTGQIEVLQTLYAEAEANRAGNEDKIGELAQVMRRLAKGVEAGGGQMAALNRIAEGQERLVAALTGPESSASVDAESRMRLRSIDVQLLRILEEISAGRQESIADLRADLTALTTAIRALSRGTVGRG
jgi:Mg2+ and Co2+ transporter CorA